MARKLAFSTRGFELIAFGVVLALLVVYQFFVFDSASLGFAGLPGFEVLATVFYAAKHIYAMFFCFSEGGDLPTDKQRSAARTSERNQMTERDTQERGIVQQTCCIRLETKLQLVLSIMVGLLCPAWVAIFSRLGWWGLDLSPFSDKYLHASRIRHIGCNSSPSSRGRSRSR